MKKLGLLLLLTALLTSCSIFQSKDKKLTSDKWILYSKFISRYKDGKSKNKLVLFKKSENKLVMNFNMNGTVHITENNGKKFATIKWNWRSDEKKYIRLNRGKYHGDFYVLKLTGKTLEISKSGTSLTDNDLMTFKHYDDSDWYSDKDVDELNKIDK